MPNRSRLLMLPCWIVALGFAPFAAGAAEISSVYTPVKLDACKDVTPPDAREYGTVWRCKGHAGMVVRVAEGDLRLFVSYGAKAEAQTAAQQTLPQFNTIGETLEWRVAKEGGRWKPFATILRFTWNMDDQKGSTLVVTKLGKTDACHLAYVKATGNPKANEQARAIADKDASGFDCKRDKPKNYAADGSLVD